MLITDHFLCSVFFSTCPLSWFSSLCPSLFWIPSHMSHCFFLDPFSPAELLWWEALTAGKDALDRVQPGAGVWHRVHHRLPGGEAGREPQQEPDAAGEGHVPCHHQNGGGTFLLVRDQCDFFICMSSKSSCYTTINPDTCSICVYKFTCIVVPGP